MTKRRVIIKVLTDHGYVLVPSGSSADHDKYVRGSTSVPVQRHRDIGNTMARITYVEAGIPRKDWRF